MELAATVSAAVAALAALAALGFAWKSGKDLRAAATALVKILGQERQLTELQGQLIGEQRAILEEQQLTRRQDRLHRDLAQLTALRQAVEDLTKAGLRAAQTEDTAGSMTPSAVAVYLAITQLCQAVTGLRLDLPHCAALARTPIQTWLAPQSAQSAERHATAEAALDELQVAAGEIRRQLEGLDGHYAGKMRVKAW